MIFYNGSNNYFSKIQIILFRTIRTSSFPRSELFASSYVYRHFQPESAPHAVIPRAGRRGRPGHTELATHNHFHSRARRGSRATLRRHRSGRRLSLASASEPLHFVPEMPHLWPSRSWAWPTGSLRRGLQGPVVSKRHRRPERHPHLSTAREPVASRLRRSGVWNASAPCLKYRARRPPMHTDEAHWTARLLSSLAA